MYILKLCLRYLRTRVILILTILSVLLGVATMIVVNGIMSGFSHEMQDRMHGVLSDVTMESRSSNGFPDAQAHMERIRKICGDKIEALTPICQTQGLLSYQIGNQWINQPVYVIGIDANRENETKDFGKYFLHPDNRKKMSFDLREDGYDRAQDAYGYSGWRYRRTLPPPTEVIREPISNPAAELERVNSQTDAPSPSISQSGNSDPAAEGVLDLPDLPSDPHAENAKLEQGDSEKNSEQEQFASAFNDPVTPPEKDASGSAVNDPFNQFRKPENVRLFDPRKEQHDGLIMGVSLASMRKDGGERFFCWPGKDVKLTMASTTLPPTSITDNFTVVDIYESKMSEFDSQFVFIPLDVMQRLRAMFDPITNKGMINAIRIKLKNENDGPLVRDMLRKEFPMDFYVIQTWQDQRSNLLSAVEIERAILNILLFLIIGVCGFSIMAIFYMIVAEKTKDIGILKALGASSSGIMSVFLLYGLLLGIVGAGLGLIAGLAVCARINPIADWIARLTGRPVFDPEIYYFYEIPVCVEPFTVCWIMAGAIFIAVAASVFPAWRAAAMQPVEALRN